MPPRDLSMWVGWYILVFAAGIAVLLLIVCNLNAPEAKQRLEIIHVIVTTAAIFVGAVWVWDEFGRERKGATRLTVDQRVTSFPIPDDQIVLQVETEFVNAGQTLVRIDHGFTRVQQVLPLDESLDKIINPARYGNSQTTQEVRNALRSKMKKGIPWPMICKRVWQQEIVIEPSEEHSWREEFLLPSSVEKVRVYTYLFSPDDRSLGWEASTIHLVEKQVGGGNEGTAHVRASDARRLCTIDSQPANSV